MTININKKSLLLLASTITMVVISACSGTVEGDVTNNIIDSPLRNESNIIDDGGLMWDIQAQSYIMEDSIISGESSLLIWVDNDELGEAIVKGFTTKFPGVNLSFQNVGSVDAVDQMALAGEAGVGADVFLIAHDHVGTAFNSSILGMMGRYEDNIRDRFLPSAVETVEIDSTLWGIPFLTETIALFYNKTLLNELYEEGIVDSPNPATSFEEIIELGNNFNDPANNRWALRFQSGDSYINYMFLSAFDFNLFGPNGDDPDSLGFDSHSTIQALEFFSTLRPIWNVNTGDISWDFTTMSFAEGNTPYLIMGPWAVEEVKAGANENNFEFGITTIPTINGVQPKTFSGNQIVAVSPYTNYPAAARVLAMYLASDEVLTFAYNDLGKIPALQDQYIYNIPGLVEDEVIGGFMNQANFTEPMPSIPEVAFFWTSAEAMWGSVWDGLVTPEDAAKRAMEDYNTLRLIGS